MTIISLGVMVERSLEETTRSLSAMNILIVSLIVLAVSASVLGSLWLSFLMQHAERLIEFVLWFNVFILVICMLVSIFMLNFYFAFIFALSTALWYWYYITVKTRIPFASAVIRTACAAIKANYFGILTTAFYLTFLQMVWFVLWIAAYFGVTQATHTTVQETEQAHGWGRFFMLLSLYWGAQVIKGVMQTTVCGTVACWWFQPTRAAPVRGSYFRASTVSFGSVCFGAFIVALMETIRTMLDKVRSRASRCGIGFLNVIFEWIERAIQYFNMYAYCYVAAYGLDFVSSGRQVVALFEKRGLTAIINDLLIGRTITMGVLALSLFTALLGALLSQLLLVTTAAEGLTADKLAISGAVLGWLMGLAVGMILVNIIESAVAMVFVSFAEDPLALE
eukprot:gene26928-33579_t